MSVSDKNFKNYFCSEAKEIPASLARFDPALIHIRPNTLNEQADATGLLWFQLSAGKSIAEQVAEVRQQFPKLKLIIMSDMPNDLEALAAFSITAKAYCNTHAGLEVLRNVSSVVEQGGVWIGESIMNRLLGQQAPVEDVKQVVESRWSALLTIREKEVATLVAGGFQNREIADRMKITERTVKAHVGAILEKLQLKNRLQLALLVKES